LITSKIGAPIKATRLATPQQTVGSRGLSSCETFLVYWQIGKVQQGPEAGSGYSLQRKVPQSYVIVPADFNLFRLYLSQHVEYGNFGIQK
jgi:hypothetical protein